MDRERYLEATELFHEACALGVAERARWLGDVCGADEELRRTVAEMLEAEVESARFLELAPRGSGERGPPPARIGPFRVVRELGHGGMGTVYECEQESPRRRVAVKVLRAGTLSRSLLARFHYEAELLGRMQHQGIAQVYAAGSEQGTDPWIAMELVEGTPIDQHAREHGLDLAARLELVARVADAAHYVHQRGVLHRDLKAANVLVDAAGQPKVLDFGVARADASGLRATLATAPGLIVGTLQTMSPEQAEASPDIDVRTDVYSLGAIAYELLAGRPALELDGQPLQSALRRLAEEEPVALGKIDRALAGDVEVVIAKALAKDRERRYASAAAFAADLRRLRRGEPVEARPPSSFYLLSKLVRRHRGLAAGGLIALGATLAGVVAFALQSRATAHAELDAAREARAAAAIDGYLVQDLLASPDPRVRGRELRVVDVLARAAQGVERNFADQPERAARVRQTLGKSFLALDELELAERELSAAHGALLALRGPLDPSTLECESLLVELFTVQTRAAEGFALGRASLARQREVLGPDHHTTLTTATNLAALSISVAELSEAEQILLDVISRRARTRGIDDPATLRARDNLAVVLSASGRMREATALREEVLALRRARFGDEHPDTVLARLFGSLDLLWQNALPDPVSTLEQLVADAGAIFGEEHHHTAMAMKGLAVALERAGDGAEAVALLERVAALTSETLGAGHAHTADAQVALVHALLRQELVEAAVQLAEALVAELDSDSSDPMARATACVAAGEAQLAARSPERAAQHFRAALRVLAPLAVASARTYEGRARAGLARTGAAEEE